MQNNYLVEVRNAEGQLDFRKEDEVRKVHPYLFSKPTFSMDELAHYVSYGQGRNQPSGPAEVYPFLKAEGISIRPKTW